MLPPQSLYEVVKIVIFKKVLRVHRLHILYYIAYIILIIGLLFAIKRKLFFCVDRYSQGEYMTAFSFSEKFVVNYYRTFLEF